MASRKCVVENEQCPSFMGYGYCRSGNGWVHDSRGFRPRRTDEIARRQRH